MIPQTVIDDVRQTADIVDIIADYVTLQPSGRNYKALSPFTKEKTPSFMVSAEKQIYKCFSSGKGGNVFTFVMEMEKVSFPEAVELVAKRSGLDISRHLRSAEAEQRKDSRTETLRWAARYFHAMLESDEGRQGYAYLAAERALSAATIKAYGLGFAPDAWDRLLQAARKEKIPHDHLASLGLVTEGRKQGRWFDAFRNRVIFPIFSVGGQVVGFGGRTLSSDPETPKYLNSPESPLFEKSKLLYGLHKAKDEIRQQGRAILVEGYMDVLALHQAGLNNAVASCGTALTRYQAKSLKRLCSEILFVYDADPAGRKSMMSGIELLLAENITPSVLELPSGEDPDSFVRRVGREGFSEYAEKSAHTFLDFQIGFLGSSGALERPETKSSAIRSIAHSIGLLPDPVLRELWLQQLSEKLTISLQALHELLEHEQARAPRRPEERRPRGETGTTPPPSTSLNVTILEKTFLKALLESAAYGTVVLEFAASHEEMINLPHPAAQAIFTHMLGRYHQIADDPEGRIDVSSEIALFGSPEAADLAASLMMEQPVSSRWTEKSDIHADNARRSLSMFLDAFRNIILEPLRHEKEVLTERIRTESDSQREIELSREKIALDRTIRKTTLELNEMITRILEAKAG